MPRELAGLFSRKEALRGPRDPEGYAEAYGVLIGDDIGIRLTRSHLKIHGAWAQDLRVDAQLETKIYAGVPRSQYIKQRTETTLDAKERSFSKEWCPKNRGI